MSTENLEYSERKLTRYTMWNPRAGSLPGRTKTLTYYTAYGDEARETMIGAIEPKGGGWTAHRLLADGSSAMRPSAVVYRSRREAYDALVDLLRESRAGRRALLKLNA